MGQDVIIKPQPTPIFPLIFKSLDASSEFEDSNCDVCKIFFSQLIVANGNDRNINEKKLI